MEIISIYGHNSIILFTQLKELGTSTFQVNGSSQVRLRVAAIPSPSRESLKLATPVGLESSRCRFSVAV